MSTSEVVNQRYSGAARQYESMPCCPGQSYDKKFLNAIPAEVIERDYGCGDPSKYVRPGDTVLDLGSGGGKLCFIAAQIAGPDGKVIGVDMNDDMLDLARGAAPKVAETLGYGNVEFRKGRIEDLSLNLQLVDAFLESNPVRNWADLELLHEVVADAKAKSPLVASSSVDVVVSNCVLNLVSEQDKKALFREIHRVLRPGGRAIISDVVCDELVPERLRADPHLWSGCVSGAMLEDQFVRAFIDAGLYGVQILDRAVQPYIELAGIEFRTVTVAAYKGKEGDCWECNQAVVYKGPFQTVQDDDGHTYERGQRTAVCEKTFKILSREPYRGMFEPVEPRVPVDVANAAPFECATGSTLRPPAETKGAPDAARVTDVSTKTAQGKSCC